MNTTANAMTSFTFQTSPTKGPNHKHDIRVVTIGDDPWFVAADVCRVLGMDVSGGTYKWLVGVASDEKRLVTSQTDPQIFCGTKARSTTLISESGLYKLVMRSDKPQAKRFQDWVTKDVLPAIRKDGGYIMGEEKVATGEMSEDELVFRAMEVMKNKIDRLRGELKEAHHTIGHHEHKLLDFCATTPINRNKVQSDLVSLGYLKPKDKRAYAKYQHYFVSRFCPRGFIVNHVTAKGKELVLQLLAEGKLTRKAA